MASIIGDSDICSSPSTITISSLLASCTLGSSGTYSHSLGSSIHYKDKFYNSASKALEAYIEDYEESLHSPAASTGNICIRTVSVPMKTLANASQQKSVSTAWNRKHRSFSSPSTRRVTKDPELVSLTTDDLLGFASDGSLPTDQNDMLMDFESKKQSRLKRHMRSSQRASSLDRNAKYDSYRTSDADERNLTRRESKRKLTLDSRHLTPNQRMNSGLYTSRSTDLQRDLLSLHTSSKDYPRWLTSQKSDLNVSGITSISETKYPIWLKNYDLLSDSISQKCSHTGKTTEENVFTAHKSSYNETFFDRYKPTLEKRDKVDSHRDNEGVLRIDPYASPSDSENVPWNGKEQFKDDQIELLILKAERTLESSNRGFIVPVKTDCSPQTEDILEADRSWEKIAVTFKSPVPVFCMDGEDTQEVNEPSQGSCYKNILKNDRQEQESTLSGGNHHGPVEALKQMLFNLQTVQQSFAHGQSVEENKVIKVASPLRGSWIFFILFWFFVLDQVFFFFDWINRVPGWFGLHFFCWITGISLGVTTFFTWIVFFFGNFFWNNLMDFNFRRGSIAFFCILFRNIYMDFICKLGYIGVFYFAWITWCCFFHLIWNTVAVFMDFLDGFPGS